MKLNININKVEDYALYVCFFVIFPHLYLCPTITLRPHLQGRQAVVICQLLSLLVAQVLDSQAEPQLLQRHRRHVVCHVIDLRVQWERSEGVKDISHLCENKVCAYFSLIKR